MYVLLAIELISDESLNDGGLTYRPIPQKHDLDLLHVIDLRLFELHIIENTEK